MTIRPLTELRDFQKCVELQRASFGMEDIDLLPVRFYVVLQSVGGLILGALEGEHLAGFLNSIPGVRDGMPYWHSQVLAVAKDYWNSGIGTQLKLAQRDYARNGGIRLIEWTFDPLESKNAYLNIEKLGAIIRRYYVDYYGRIASTLHTGLDTDRVIAEWWIDRPRFFVTGDVHRLRIPSDIQSLKRQDPASARDAQARVRREFLANTEADYFVAGFEQKDGWSEYLFIPGASRVDTPN